MTISVLARGGPTMLGPAPAYRGCVIDGDDLPSFALPTDRGGDSWPVLAPVAERPDGGHYALLHPVGATPVYDWRDS